MIIQLHTPKGIVEIDTDKATDAKLLQLGVKRENLPKPPRDLAAEIDDIKVNLRAKGIM